MSAATILQQARQECGITQVELARRVGMTQAQVSGIERRNASIATVQKLLSAMGFRVSFVEAKTPCEMCEELPGRFREVVDVVLCDPCVDQLKQIARPTPIERESEPLRPHRVEGGSLSCAYCNHTFTFNMMRDEGPFVCHCAESRAARDPQNSDRSGDRS